MQDITNSPYFKKINNGYYLTRRGQLVFGHSDPYTWQKKTNSESVTMNDVLKAFGLTIKDIKTVETKSSK